MAEMMKMMKMKMKNVRLRSLACSFPKPWKATDEGKGKFPGFGIVQALHVQEMSILTFLEIYS